MSLEGVLHADTEVVVLSVAVTFFALNACKSAPLVVPVPIGNQSVVKARAINGIGLDGFHGTVDTTVTNG